MVSRGPATPHIPIAHDLNQGTRRYGSPSEGVAAMTQAAEDPVLHILWMNGGLGCDGDSVALTAATQPSIEEIALGALPGLPKVAVHWPLIDFECGPEQGADNFIEWWHRADRGELDPFVLVVEGSVPNEAIKEEGYWCGFGNNPATGQPMTTNEWLDRLAPKATAILAVGTCATYGGIHAMAGNPTGAMGVPDYLGWDWRSKAGLPIVCVPGCPIQPDNLSETILYLLYQVAGQAPMIPLDEALRPTWLFGATVHEGCDRAGYYEQGDFATKYGSSKCLVKLGCWGPVVKCNVPCSATPGAGPTRSGRCSWAQYRRWCRDSPAASRSTCRCRSPMTWRSARPGISPAWNPVRYRCSCSSAAPSSPPGTAGWPCSRCRGARRRPTGCR